MNFSTVRFEDIVIPENRQRVEFDPDAMQELIDSIKTNGLLHAPVMREEDGKVVLVAGERRLRALTDMWGLGDDVYYAGTKVEDGLVPYVSLGSLSLIEAEEAELDENLKRRDLTWQEHASAVQRLHNLRIKQKAGSDDGVLVSDDKAHKISDTAKEVLGRADGGFHEQIRREILVAQHLGNPEVSKAKSADEAFKILKKAETRKKNEELAEAIGPTFNSASHTLIHGNCLEWMAGVEKKFDVILTDPPYGMGAERFGNAAGKLAGIEHHYDDSPEHWEILMTKWAHLAYKVAKDQAHAYVFCDFDKFHNLKYFMETAGWYVFRTPFIVHKLNSGRVPLPDRGPRRSWEMTLYAIKGEKPVTQIMPDVIPCQGDREDASHGAQKPVELYQNLLSRSVRPGDSVLDSFAGTGTIFPAAHLHKVYATGIELNPEYYAISANRLKECK
jgi:DNA modification methylase/ParB-like chromosome segregation protein Spo0J